MTAIITGLALGFIAFVGMVVLALLLPPKRGHQ